MDFSIHITHAGEIRILQLTDTQVIDADQRRRPDRIGGWKLTSWVPERDDANVYAHIRYLVQQAQPDLILLTGDLIYGEFDDSGRSFMKFVSFMDSLQIPWLPVYGNHDNESRRGVDWQNAQLEASRYACFARGSVSGNGNYSVGIYQQGALVRVLLMMDTHGCGRPSGFREDQLAWMQQQADAVHAVSPDVPLFLCCHVPTLDFMDAYLAAGYQAEPDIRGQRLATFEIGGDVPAKNGDLGRKMEDTCAVGQRLLPQLHACGIDGFFVGHCHIINTSVLYEGIRFTFGYKTGYYDYYDPTANGGALITLQGSAFTVRHLLYPGEEERV